MKTLTINLPDALTPEQEHDLRMELAGAPYTRQLLASGEAAALARIGRGKFIKQLGKYGYSLLANYSEADLDHDLAAIHRYLGHELPDSAG